MAALLAATLGLAVAGIDPVGAVLAVSALAGGIRSRWVFGYGIVVIVGTAAIGTVLSLTVGRGLSNVDWSFLVPQGAFGAIIEIAVAIALLVWAALRLRNPDASAKKPKRRRSGGPALLVLGLVFAASAALDPTFVGLVVVAGRGESFGEVALAHLLWIAVSQSPLVALLIALVFRRHERMVAAAQRWWTRHRMTVRHILTVVLALAGLALLVDGIWFLATGEFLIAPDFPP